MAQLVAWMFGDEQGAHRLEPVLRRLAAEQGLLLRDGRVVVWPTGHARVVARRVYSVPLTDALDDIFWGLLFGRVLYGTDTSESAELTASGVDAEVVEGLRRGLVPGCSAMIVMADDEQVEFLADALAPGEPEIRVAVAGDGAETLPGAGSYR